MPDPSAIPHRPRPLVQLAMVLVVLIGMPRARSEEPTGGVVLPLPRPAFGGGGGATVDDPSAPPVSIRVVWGGGKPRRWSGSIRLVGDAPGEDAPPEVALAVLAAPNIDWRLLSPDAMATARIHATGRALSIHQPAECPLDGVEIKVVDWSTDRLVVDLVPDGRVDEATHVDVGVAELFGGPLQQSLDDDANRLTVRRAPGDELRVTVEGGAVHVPGETVRIDVHPLLPPRAPGTATVELRVKVRDTADGTETFARTFLLNEFAPAPGAGAVEETPRRFGAIGVEVPLPAREGAFDVAMEVTERGGLRWARPLAARTVQVVAVTASAGRAQGDGEWRTVYELDPNSPRPMERLRRLPAMGRSAASNLPHVPLPALPIPKVSLPAMSIPGLSAVGQVVPRLTGLLPSGHSTLEPHPAGALFRLPAARSPEEPSWEAIHLAGAVPGAPHRIQIDHPLSDDETVTIAVLEQVGATVVTTFRGGFAVEGNPGSTDLVRHECTFWPHTRSPLVMILNASLRRPAPFGTVRILSGPTRLPTPQSIAASRSLYGFVTEPDMSRFGGIQAVDAATGRAVSDWRSLLSAARTSAEWFAAQGTSGAMVTVYAEGAAAWPSVVTAAAPRWDGGGSVDASLDRAPKDAVEVLCRVYRRQGLKLVPAIECNGPLLPIEARLAVAPGDSAGLVCVGRDGRPRRGAAADMPARYNILDPRVQAAVEDVVGELAGRLEGREAVDGLAILLPHDGWLHLPGIAWALDDVTFTRFVGDTPAAAAAVAAAGPAAMRGDESRFALRAALVEGPLRDAWLDWRAGVVAGFVGRLAARVAAHGPSWTLSVVPTTLFSAGELATRFRPVLAAEPSDADICREIGLDPARLTARDGVVWVSPHVHAATDDMVERDAIRAMNRSPCLGAAAAGARRRAAVVIERATEIDIRAVLAQGSFGGTTADGPVPCHAVRTGSIRMRTTSDLFAAGDCERVYDEGLSFRTADALDRRTTRMLAALPAARMESVPGTPRPLVLRAASARTGAAILVSNHAPRPCRAILDLAGGMTSVVEGGGDGPLRVDGAGTLAVDLAPWQTRVIGGVGPAALRGSRVEFAAGLEETVRLDLERLRRRRAALEMPAPLAVLDNPGFEQPDHGGDVPGWELLEPQRGKLRIGPGAPEGQGRGIAFSSDNGLATLRSNPFPAPSTGRISIALWLRIDAEQPEPQLRIALEGVQDDREYYRFAALGQGPASRPLTPQWSQYVLQVDDLPTRGLESLRVRIDLLAGGAIHVDDVRVFDLAFDESQRVQLSKALALAEHHLADRDLGACIIDLDAHWPRFLDTFVTDEAAEQAALAAGLRGPRLAAGGVDTARGTSPPTGPGEPGSGAKAPPAAEDRTGILDRVRRWWK